MTTCKVDGCGAPARSRGWCDPHYKRWWRYGDPLGGSTSKGDVSEYFNNFVLSYDGDDCLSWPYAKLKGYGQIRHGGKRRCVSRLICEIVNGPPPSPKHEAAHNCGKGHEGCCNPKHIRWDTPKGNSADKIIHGTTSRGERAPSVKLTAEQVLTIRILAGKLLQQEIGEMFGVHFSTISAIITRKLWRHI